MPTAEIITIGTEILLGEIVDTNARFIARCLRDIGVDLYRKTTVGDNARRIAQVVQEGLSRADILITTGGLGPTVDDPTRDAIAAAINVASEYRPELWEQIQARFRRFNRQPTENNRRQAYIPQGAITIENPVGTAPAFYIEKDDRLILCLPGVPREMEYLMKKAVIPFLRRRYQLRGIIKARVLHTAGIGESQIDDLIGDLETYTNPTIGLSAHSGQVDVRITAKANEESEADRLIAEIEGVLRKRLGNWIYGCDEDTLEEAVMTALQAHHWSLAAVEAGLKGELIRRLASAPGSFRGGEMIEEQLDSDGLREAVVKVQQQRGAEVVVGVSLIPGGEVQHIYILALTPQGEQSLTRPFGGPPGDASRWAVHHSLDLLRRL